MSLVRAGAVAQVGASGSTVFGSAGMNTAPSHVFAVSPSALSYAKENR